MATHQQPEKAVYSALLIFEGILEDFTGFEGHDPPLIQQCLFSHILVRIVVEPEKKVINSEVFSGVEGAG